MSANQPRKPAGTPAGGQWAPMAHAEPEVDLVPERHRSDRSVPKPSEDQAPITVGTHQGPVQLTPGVIDDQATLAFHNGHCISLAKAMSDETGWPVVAHLSRPGDLSFERGVDGSTITADLPFDAWADAFVHAMVEAPDGSLVDIDGAHNPDDYRAMAYDVYGTAAIAYIDAELLEQALASEGGQWFDHPEIVKSFARAVLDEIGM